MRILEVITPSRIGGAETHVATITEALTALGDEVTVFCPARRPLVDYLLRRGIDPVTWETHGKFDSATLIGLSALIRARQIDVIHTHLSTASFLGSVAARIAGRPSIATVHGFNSAGWYRFSGQIIAVSHAVKKHLTNQGVPQGKIQVVYNGITLDRYEPRPLGEAKLASDLEPSFPRVGVFARLSPEKGQETALRAWPEVVREVPNARLMLVGAGSTEQELRAAAAELDIETRVEFAGFRTDPIPLMASCDVVLVPSLKEGLGLAAIEGMALERPVVATDAGGLPEILTDGETGLTVPRGEPRAMSAAILKLLGDPGLRSRLGSAGRKRAQERFDATRQTAELREALANAR